MVRILKYVFVCSLPVVMLAVLLAEIGLDQEEGIPIPAYRRLPSSALQSPGSGNPDRIFLPRRMNDPPDGRSGTAGTGREGGSTPGDSARSPQPASPWGSRKGEVEPGRGPAAANPMSPDRQPFTIRVVSRTGGGPIPDARVALSVKGVGFFRESTAPEGKASFTLPADFTGRCVVLSPDHSPGYEVIVQKGDSSNRVLTVHLADRLPGEGALVTVTDRLTSTPVVDATVTLSDSAHTAWDKTDDRGELRLPTGIFTAPLALKFESADYHSARMTIPPSPEKSDLSIGLSRKDPLIISVVAADGGPCPGGTVRLRCEGEGWRGNWLVASADSSGEIRFPDLTTGPDSAFRLVVLDEGHLPWTGRWTLEEYKKGRGEFTIQLKKGRAVSGLITGAGVADESELVVELRPHGPGLAGITRALLVAPGEIFTAEDVQGAGGLQVRVRGERGVYHVGKADIGSDGFLEIEIPPLTEITVRVVGPSLEPVAGARVFFSRRDEGFPSFKMEGRTDEAGVFSLLGRAPVRLDCAVKAEGYRETGFRIDLKGDDPDRSVEVRLGK
ncbi:MAG: carboxypeptidase-like regulatory domain-containing protein [Planctomycetota bacterium]